MKKIFTALFFLLSIVGAQGVTYHAGMDFQRAILSPLNKGLIPIAALPENCVKCRAVAYQDATTPHNSARASQPCKRDVQHGHQSQTA